MSIELISLSRKPVSLSGCVYFNSARSLTSWDLRVFRLVINWRVLLSAVSSRLSLFLSLVDVDGSYGGKIFGLYRVKHSTTVWNPGPTSITYYEWSVIKLFSADTDDSITTVEFTYLDSIVYSNRLTRYFRINNFKKAQDRHKLARYVFIRWESDDVATIDFYRTTKNTRVLIKSVTLPVSSGGQARELIRSARGECFDFEFSCAGYFKLKEVDFE